MTTTTTRHFDPRPPQVVEHLPAALRAVYEYGDLTVPPLLQPVEAALAAEPTPADVVRQAATTALGNDRSAEWLEQAITAYTRAEAVAAIVEGIARHRNRVLAQNTEALVSDAVDATQPAFEAWAAELHAASKKLPRDRPLDVELIVESDAAREWEQAIAALSALAVWASMFPPVQAGRGITPMMSRVLAVVNVPEIQEAQRIDRITRAALGEVDPRRDEVKEFDRCVHADVDEAIVRCARGDWPSLTLSLASGPEHHRERLDLVQHAISVQVADSRGSRKVRVRA